MAQATPQAGSSSPSPTAADRLFDEGRILLGNNQITEACQKFAESFTLVPRSGTLLNLAECRRREGKFATALPLFVEARQRALADGRQDRVEVIDKAIAEVKKVLAFAAISLDPGADLPSLTITVDDTPLPREKWSSPFALDPGKHKLVATWVDHLPQETSFEIPTTAGQVNVTLHAPTPVPKPHIAPPLPSPSTSPTVAAPPDSTAPMAPQRPLNQSSWKAPVALTMFGLGLTGLGLGAGFGFKAIFDNDESRRLCPDDFCPTQMGLDKNASARESATISNIALLAGLVLTASGAWFYFTGRRSPQPAAKVSLFTFNAPTSRVW